MFYFPLHIYNFFATHCLPRRLFVLQYTPSSEEVRKNEEAIRNKIRKLTYMSKVKPND